MPGTLTNIKRRVVRGISKARIRKALQTAQMACPICGNTAAFTTVFEIDRYGLPITTVRCDTCTLLFTNPAPTDAFLNTFYSSTMFRGLDWGVLKPNGRVLQEFNASGRAKNHIRFFKEVVFPKSGGVPSSILDIGSSDGTFLREFAKVFPQVTRFCIEPGKMFRKETEKEFERIYDAIEDVPEDKSFDILTAWHVLEHVRDPGTFLKHVASHMNASSRFVFEVPDADRFGTDIRPIHVDHICHYTEKTLGAVLEKAGLVIETVTRDSQYVGDNVYGIKVVAKKG